MPKLLSSFVSGVLLFLLAACGGGSSPNENAPPSIGAAGGSVSGPGGAGLSVPAGALSQPVALTIAQSSAGAPSLPPGIESAGAVYALTPHGTTFLSPVTVTIPFDASSVPDGRSVQLLKTNAAQDGWDVVAGATASGSVVTAQVDRLSWFGVFLVPSLPTITAQPVNLTVTEGQGATFSVTAQPNGGPVLMYQWQRDDVDIPGAVGSSYTVTSASLADNGARFAVVVNNGVGTVRSGDAALTVNPPASGSWTNIGSPAAAGGNYDLGGLAVSSTGRVALSYLSGSGGAGGAPSEVRVAEWDGANWRPLGGALNPPSGVNPRIGPDGVAYDGDDRPVVTWVDPLTGDWVVQRWTGTAWESLGTLVWRGGSTTGAPSIQIDPSNGRLVARLISAIHVNVFEWSGTAWTTGTLDPFGTNVLLRSGVRLSLRNEDEPFGATLQNLRLYRREASGDYEPLGGVALNAPIANDFGLVLSLATEGVRPYLLAGHHGSGPVGVRVWTGSQWQSIGGDIGIRDTGGVQQFRITPAGVPIVVHRFGPWPHRLGGHWWDGAAWRSASSPIDASVGVVWVALAVGPDSTPYVALALRPASSVSRPNELRVLRLRP